MKPGKLQTLISNKALKDDMVIQVGDDSFTMGELRAMDAESDGATTAALAAREEKLVLAQGALAQTLQTLSEKLGVPVETLISGNLEGVEPRRVASSGGEGDADPLSEIDPKILAALEKKFGSSALTAEIEGLKKELKVTKTALGTAMKVNMDDWYADQFSRHAKDLPEGVSLNLADVLKFADDNNLREKNTGRYNIQKAVSDMTLEARHRADIIAAEKRGEDRRAAKQLADSVRPGGGAPGHQHLKPPVDDKGRTHTIEHQLHAALEDTDIQRMISGVNVGAA